MKKLFLLSTLLGLVACSDPHPERRITETPVIVAESASAVQQYTATEFCYDRVVYVRFSAGNAAWGGAKMYPNGHAVVCL